MTSSTPPRRVLVGLDFSVHARWALERATRLPVQTGGVIDVAHAIEEERFSAIVAHREAEARELLDYVSVRAEPWISAPHRLTLETSFHWGDAAGVLDDRARRMAADYVVIGRRKERRLGDVMVGSTGDRVIRNASVPVLVVATPPAAPYRRPLVALDLADGSRAVLTAAARICDSVAIDVLHVISDPSRRHATDAHHKESALRDVASFVASVNLPVTCNVGVMFGEPRAAILEYARERDVDLIAVGTRGRGTVARLLLGSVAQSVVRGAACDVLVAR